jgi:hypothetical protein
MKSTTTMIGAGNGYGVFSVAVNTSTSGLFMIKSAMFPMYMLAISAQTKG